MTTHTIPGELFLLLTNDAGRQDSTSYRTQALAAAAVGVLAGVSPAPHRRAGLRRIGTVLEGVAVVALVPLVIGAFADAVDAALLPGELEVARLIVSALSLENRAEDIAPEEPLFGAGLGLDSIDALELALAISKTYGVQLRSDDERNHRIFSSLRTLTAHIEKHRVR